MGRDSIAPEGNGCGEEDARHVGGGRLVVAGGDPPPALEPAPEAFDEVAGAVNFVDKVRFNLGLLSEVVGEAHLYSADISDEEFAQLQTVDWEMLPPGSTDRVIARLAKSKNVTPERMRVAESRLHMLDRLGHDGFIIGIGRFSRYFGARFGDLLVALENLEYGNALYLFEQDWERLSQVSRSKLIRRRDPEVHRIPHVEGWQPAIRKTLRKLGHS